MTPHRIVPGIVLAASLGLAAQGCGLVSPTYGDLFEMQVRAYNGLPIDVRITGPGEILPDLTPAVAAATSTSTLVDDLSHRVINLGQRSKGDRVTFVGWSTTNIRGPEVTCEVEAPVLLMPARVLLVRNSQANGQTSLTITCDFGLKPVSNRDATIPGL